MLFGLESVAGAMVEDVRGRHAKRLAAFEMVDGVTGDNGSRRITLGADKPVLSLSKGATMLATSSRSCAGAVPKLLETG